ncbi:MAG: ornithine cyclodeaminase family protein [Rhodospirillaceae bacterium]|jgi:alanine dehydrogenase|nr:ornithine cyclodeaminase family protein [Rhodospirillaceae bacterium]
MTLFLTNEEVEKLVTVEDAIEVLEPTFADLGAGRLSSRPRTLNYTGLGDGEFYLYSCMDSSVPRYGVHLIRMTSEHLARKTVAGFPRRFQIPNPAGKFSGLIIMFSIEDHAPLALFQDAVLNRTMIGATSGIAAKYISREDSEVMALLGAGWLAPTQVIGHCAVRPIKEIRVYGPTEEHKIALCNDLEGRVDAKLIPVKSTEEAVEGADIIACATNSYEPVFDGAMLKPGHYVGSLQVGELDDLTHDRADTITARAREPATIWHMKSGEEPPDQLWLDRWKPKWDKKLKFLGEIVEGLDQARTSNDDITVYGGVGTGPSSGLGLQYIPAWIAYQRAREQGIGFEIPDELFLQDAHP